MKTLHHKLVRDRIPEIIEESGKTHQTTIIDGEDLKKAALKKLLEEAMEFVENPSAEEAADIVEILHFILNREGITDAQVMTAVTVKRIECGGFDMGYLLEWVEE
ncbi:MAG: nucleoside triphosphate pyrophosphohydrolase [Betaproteobacteria bacterium]|jgi:predicted house-cleaning noncanonical NTP pyrophosphatase (MazG superfamily)